MTKTITTIKDATHEWVREMNAFPRSMIEKLMEIDIDDWQEVTPLHKDCRVYSLKHNEYGYIIKYNEKTELYTVELDNDKRVRLVESEIERTEYDNLPMWGTMWSFGDSCDDWWLEEEDGIRQMAECGFRIYNSYEFGYFFGIDGAGYDFYESHWIPLYKKRGLKWHDTEER